MPKLLIPHATHPVTNSLPRCFEETVQYADREVQILNEARHPCIIRGVATFGPLAAVVNTAGHRHSRFL